MNGKAFYRMTVKRMAKEVLSRSFLKLIVPVLAYALLLTAFSMLGAQAAQMVAQYGDMAAAYTQTAFTLLSMVLCAPLATGMVESCVARIEGREISMMDVFSWVGDGGKLGRSLLLGLYLALIMAFWTGVALAIVMGGSELLLAKAPALFDNVLFSSVYLMVVLAISALSWARMNIYQPAYILLAERPELSPFACLKEAGRIMRPYWIDFLLFSMSFMLWVVVSVFTMGIILIYLFPYYFLAMIYFFRGCIQLDGKAPPPELIGYPAFWKTLNISSWELLRKKKEKKAQKEAGAVAPTAEKPEDSVDSTKEN